MSCHCPLNNSEADLKVLVGWGARLDRHSGTLRPLELHVRRDWGPVVRSLAITGAFWSD